MQLLGPTTDISSMIPTDADTTLNFSDENLSTDLFELGLKLGERFAKKVGKDVELYQAEALYVLTEICKLEDKRYLGKDIMTRVPITDEVLLIRAVYRGLYEYYYADRVVCASRSTVWRQEQEDRQVVTANSLTTDSDLDGGLSRQNDVVDKRVSEVDMIETFNDVARSAREKEYLYLKLQGADEAEIANSMGICERVLNDMRARIAKRLKKSQRRDLINEE